MMRYLSVLLTIVLCACGGENLSATLAAQRDGYPTQAVGVALTLAARQQDVDALVQVLNTQAAQLNLVNQELLATVAAGSTATIQVVPGYVPANVYGSDAVATEGAGGVTDQYLGAPVLGTLTVVAPPAFVPDTLLAATPAAGGTQFVGTGLTTAVSDVDGCAAAPLQNLFASTDTIIYAVTRALNIRAGTVMRVSWTREGVEVDQYSFAVAQDDDDFCIWFSITPQDTPFTPGTWSVQIFADDVPVQAPTAFVMQ